MKTRYLAVIVSTALTCPAVMYGRTWTDASVCSPGVPDMNPRLFAAIVLAALTCTAATYGRTWTDASGNYSVGAELEIGRASCRERV